MALLTEKYSWLQYLSINYNENPSEALYCQDKTKKLESNQSDSVQATFNLFVDDNTLNITFKSFNVDSLSMFISTVGKSSADGTISVTLPNEGIWKWKMTKYDSVVAVLF